MLKELTKNGAFNLDARGNIKIKMIGLALTDSMEIADQHCVSHQLRKEIQALEMMRAAGRFVTQKVNDSID